MLGKILKFLGLIIALIICVFAFTMAGFGGLLVVILLIVGGMVIFGDWD